MWMMGCNDGSGLHTSDSYNGRKLRPLIPRPTTTTTTTKSSSCFNRIHSSTDLFPLHNHHLEPGKREVNSHPLVSSRWNPTTEQLRILEDLYRSGTRTPSTEQIQHITAQLRRYGKIEGKNVFYWFQNHKARERQKRRRQIEEFMAVERDSEGLERKYSGMSRTDGCKSWSPPTNCSILTEESASASKAEITIEGRHKSSPEENATWHSMHLYSLPHLINTTPIATHATTITTTTTTAAYEPVDPEILINDSFDIGDEHGQSRTLELFPLHRDGIAFAEKTQLVPSAPTMAMENIGPYQFFQFL